MKMKDPASYIEDVPEASVMLGLMQRFFLINEELARTGTSTRLEPVIWDIGSIDEVVTIHGNLDAYMRSFYSRHGARPLIGTGCARGKYAR